MAGHSKWHNIQRRKGKQDSVRGQLFTKLSRDIYHAAKEGGGNPDTNFRLKTAVDRARASNVPMENINRTIAKATGTLPGVTFEELVYEGYGPSGVAVMLEVVTDNRNRTAAAIRHIFSKRGGNLGETGCVGWMFRRVGRLAIAKDTTELSLDDLILQAIDAGADDVRDSEDGFEIITAPEQFAAVRDAFEQQGVIFADTEITYEPTTYTPVDDSVADAVIDLIEALEENDDVQTVYTNVELHGDASSTDFA